MLFALKDFVLRWKDAQGRTSCEAYWFVMAFCAVLAVLENIFFFASYIMTEPAGWKALNRTYGGAVLFQGVVLMVPYITLSIRRLHDVGRSGGWLLLAIVPALLLGGITALGQETLGMAEGNFIGLWSILLLVFVLGSGILLVFHCLPSQGVAFKEETLAMRFEDVSRDRTEEEIESSSFQEALTMAHFQAEYEEAFETIDEFLTQLESCCRFAFCNNNQEEPSDVTHLWGMVLGMVETVGFWLAEARTSVERSVHCERLENCISVLNDVMRDVQQCGNEELQQEVVHIVEKAKEQIQKLLGTLM